mmetsp:Transcript_21273/g.75662  ORF Transcript_21273/g.75662 Transcript_21273/m.75662 type:complete len:277 (-) Transcript_21273:222-1052(-)
MLLLHTRHHHGEHGAAAVQLQDAASKDRRRAADGVCGKRLEFLQGAAQHLPAPLRHGRDAVGDVAADGAAELRERRHDGRSVEDGIHRRRRAARRRRAGRGATSRRRCGGKRLSAAQRGRRRTGALRVGALESALDVGAPRAFRAPQRLYGVCGDELVPVEHGGERGPALAVLRRLDEIRLGSRTEETRILQRQRLRSVETVLRLQRVQPARHQHRRLRRRRRQRRRECRWPADTAAAFKRVVAKRNRKARHRSLGLWRPRLRRQGPALLLKPNTR